MPRKLTACVTVAITLSLIAPLITGPEPAAAQTIDATTSASAILPLELDKGESNIDKQMYQGLYNFLQSEGKANQSYYIGSINKQGEWALISLSKLNKTLDKKMEGTFLGEESLILAKTNDGGISWEFAFEKDSRFKIMLRTAPERLVDKNTKELMSGQVMNSDKLAINATAAVKYKFPWQEFNNKTYSQAWHGTQVTGLDFGSSAADRRILSSAAGSITGVSICTYSVNVTVKHADGKSFKYLHLNKNDFDSSKIKVGVSVAQGKKLGNLRAGSFSDNCGYASQTANYSHLHWGLPTSGTNTIDQWSIAYSNKCWTKPGFANRCVGSTFGSTNKEV